MEIFLVTVINVCVLLVTKFIFRLIKVFIKSTRFKAIYGICENIFEQIYKEIFEDIKEIHGYLKKDRCYRWITASIFLVIYFICFQKNIYDWFLNLFMVILFFTVCLVALVKSSESIMSHLSCFGRAITQVAIISVTFATLWYMLMIAYFKQDFAVSLVTITATVCYIISFTIIFIKYEVKWVSQIVIFIVYVGIKFLLSKYELDSCKDYFEFFAFYKEDVMDEVLNLTLLAYGLKSFTSLLDTSTDKLKSR